MRAIKKEAEKALIAEAITAEERTRDYQLQYVNKCEECIALKVEVERLSDFIDKLLKACTCPGCVEANKTRAALKEQTHE